MFVTIISIHLVIICVVFFGAHMRRNRLYPLNPGVTEVVSEKKLTVGRNLDRTGQNPYLFNFTLILSILFLILSHFWLFYSDYFYLFYSRKTRRISHLRILHLRLPKEIGDLRQIYGNTIVESVNFI
jgi:hypothetical protein